MGTSYHPFCLNDEVIQWLDSEGVSHPPASGAFRNPTPIEIEAVLGALPGYTYKISRNLEEHTWYADVAWKKDPPHGPWAEISISDYRGDDLPHVFHFTKGWEEPIFLIMERLSHICGPLAVADGSDATPYLVTSGADVRHCNKITCPTASLDYN
jgi:hypothetical protein